MKKSLLLLMLFSMPSAHAMFNEDQLSLTKKRPAQTQMEEELDSQEAQQLSQGFQNLWNNSFSYQTEVKDIPQNLSNQQVGNQEDAIDISIQELNKQIADLTKKLEAQKRATERVDSQLTAVLQTIQSDQKASLEGNTGYIMTEAHKDIINKMIELGYIEIVLEKLPDNFAQQSQDERNEFRQNCINILQPFVPYVVKFQADEIRKLVEKTVDDEQVNEWINAYKDISNGGAWMEDLPGKWLKILGYKYAKDNLDDMLLGYKYAKGNLDYMQ